MFDLNHEWKNNSWATLSASSTCKANVICLSGCTDDQVREVKGEGEKKTPLCSNSRLIFAAFACFLFVYFVFLLFFFFKKIHHCINSTLQTQMPSNKNPQERFHLHFARYVLWFEEAQKHCICISKTHMTFDFPISFQK